jgi:hypothetical protein
MKQHLVAFGAAALDLSAGLVTVPFIADGLIRASSNIMQLNENWDVQWAFAGGVNLSRLRLNSAQSRIRGFPNLVPFMNAVDGGDNPAVADFRNAPIKLYNGENVNLQGTNAAAVDTVALLSLVEAGQQAEPTPPGARRVRFTAAPTTVAFGWSQAANIVLDDDLEAGIYGVYGLSTFQATVQAARLVFKDQVEKPGVVSCQTAVQRPFPPFLNGLGKMGEFWSLTPPFIEVLADAAAGVTVTGYLNIQKLR